jgi:selenium metabolism protein YedF
VINAKKALSEPGSDGVTVLVDNEVAVQNLEKMAAGSGYGFSWKEEGAGRYAVTITGGGAPPAGALEKETARPLPASPNEGGLVILIGADHLGEGAEELGKMLIKGFIFSVSQLSPPPEAIIFINGGARLTPEGAGTVPDLLALAEKGVTILTCGTCANYYGIKDALAVGAITDMMDIVNRISGAGKLVTV